jgi:hypothetical protein
MEFGSFERGQEDRQRPEHLKIEDEQRARFLGTR